MFSPADAPPSPLDGRHLVVYSESTSVGGAEASLAALIATFGPEARVTVVGRDERVVGWIAARRPGTDALTLPPLMGLRDVRGFVAHARAFRRLRPDLVHVNMPASWFGLYPALVALLVRGPRVVLVEHAPARIPRRRDWHVKRFVSRRAAAHVAVGHRSAAVIEADLELPAGSVTPVHPGVEDRPATPAQRPAAAKVVAAAGRLEPAKGFDVLVRAAAGLEGVAVTICGEGAARSRLEALAHELGVDLRLPGWTSDPRPAMAAADVFVQASRFESFGLVVLEAMLVGTPVVVVDVGSVVEAVRDGETGLVVPPEDPAALHEAIRRLLTEPGLADRLSAAARELAREHFTVEAMSRRYAALYARALA